MLAAMALPRIAVATAVASTKATPSRPAAARMARRMRSVGSEKSASRVKSPGENLGRVDDKRGAPLLRRRAPAWCGWTTRSQPSTRSPRRQSSRMASMSSGNCREHVAVDGAALLGKAGHVDHAAALALEMRRHAEDRADGHNAGAADAGDDDVVGALNGRKRRLGSSCPHPSRLPPRRACASGRGADRERRGFAPCTVTKDGQKPRRHEKSLLQLDWSIWRFLPKLGLERLHGDAVGLHRTIAAALADEIVDDQRACRDRRTRRVSGAGASRPRQSGRR